MGGTTQYQDGSWLSGDALRLHYRDYAGPKSKPPILCIPGLTRNARDFAHVAERLAGDWRVICVDLRGRGERAAAAESASYTPATYLADLEALLAKDEATHEHSVKALKTWVPHLASLKKKRKETLSERWQARGSSCLTSST